jgi:hypothetical protein
MNIVFNVNYISRRVASAGNVTEEKCASSLAVFCKPSASKFDIRWCVKPAHQSFTVNHRSRRAYCSGLRRNNKPRRCSSLGGPFGQAALMFFFA